MSQGRAAQYWNCPARPWLTPRARGHEPQGATVMKSLCLAAVAAWLRRRRRRPRPPPSWNWCRRSPSRASRATSTTSPWTARAAAVPRQQGQQHARHRGPEVRQAGGQKAGQTAIQGVAYSPELNRIFVGLGTGGLCNIIDGESYKILKTVKFKDDADNVALQPEDQPRLCRPRGEEARRDRRQDVRAEGRHLAAGDGRRVRDGGATVRGSTWSRPAPASSWSSTPTRTEW